MLKIINSECSEEAHIPIWFLRSNEFNDKEKLIFAEISAQYTPGDVCVFEIDYLANIIFASHEKVWRCLQHLADKKLIVLNEVGCSSTMAKITLGENYGGKL